MKDRQACVLTTFFLLHEERTHLTEKLKIKSADIYFALHTYGSNNSSQLHLGNCYEYVNQEELKAGDK